MDAFAVLSSTKNSIFKDFIQRKIDAWEEGTDTTLDALSSAALSKYNNMVKQKTWDEKNPKDAKIIALATQVEALQSQTFSKNKSGEATTFSGNENPNKRKTDLPDWRMKKGGRVEDG